MRISGGLLKGRRLARPSLTGGRTRRDILRPTSSKVREALFDILRSDIHDALFLDLYAGTGAVGFEALSQGADKTIFVEHEAWRQRAIKEALEKLGLGNRASVFSEKAERFLANAAARNESFDIIFADPPYASSELDIIMPLIDGSGVLKEGGCLVAEHPSKTRLTDSFETLELVKNYRYGDTMLTLYRKKP